MIIHYVFRLFHSTIQNDPAKLNDKAHLRKTRMVRSVFESAILR